ncbi:helix-turn-helix domain-containing protein [Paraburkholderia fungorum]|uniref:helix-turn-helix domain-containing protein n=1 Tax=Paraburkholderia fungorum TaxID=134537 RepID=UPI0038B9763D
MTGKENGRQPKPTTARTKAKNTGNSIAAQCARLYEALQLGPMTTIEIRRDLDVLMPAARIWDLKHKQGKPIEKYWVDRPTASGNLHRVAMYALMPPKLVSMPTQTLDLFRHLEAA